MVTLDKSIDIRAPPERVFRAITRVCRIPQWDSGVSRAAADAATGPVAPGFVFHTVEEAAGIRWSKEAEATAVENDRRFAWRQRRGDFARHEGFYELTPSPGGTRLRLRMQVELPFILPTNHGACTARQGGRFVTDEEIARALSQREDHALLRLKDLLEREPV